MPALIQDDEFEAASGSGQAEEKVQHIADSQSPAGADIEYYDVDRAKLALHRADGNKCGCDLCKAVKQRRRGAKASSHPHSEEKIRMTNVAHTFGCVCVAVYWDMQDYGPENIYIFAWNSLRSLGVLCYHCCHHVHSNEIQRH